MNQQKPARTGGSPSSRRPVQATRILVALTLVGGLVFAMSVALVVWIVTWEGGGKVNEASFLEVRLKGDVPDAPVTGGLFLEPEDFPPLVTDIAGAIRASKDDPRITGLFLDLETPSVGWAGYREIREAIVELREAGKPCIAYSEMYTTGTYYLASACDTVVMGPSGVGLVTGLATNVTYYAGTFDKIGVDAEMLHVGDFKSAVEPYERTGPSEPAALAMEQMLDSLWGVFLAEVAAGRGITTEQVQALIDVPAMSPKRALERGLVDVLAYRGEVRARASAVKEDGWAASLAAPVTEDEDDVDERFTTLKQYLKGYRQEQAAGLQKIAVVYASGPILEGEVSGGIFGEQVLTDGAFSDWLEEIRADDSVKAVVVRVNSPGGSGLASDNMWRELERTKAEGRPVVVSMGNYAASGGYFISAPADWIVAQPNTLTGSIGVFGGKITFAGTMEKLGITEHTFARGAQANLLSATSPFDEQGRAVYQAFLDDFYEHFLGRVMEGRELDRDTVHAVAQGRVWTGEQALERKLVDQIGGLDEAVAKAAELASLGEDYGVARWPKEKGFVELLLEDLDEDTSVTLEVPGIDVDPLVDLLVLERILSTGAAALLPGDLRLSE